MSYLNNPYEAEFLREDRAKQIAHQVKQYRGTNQVRSKVWGRLLAAALVFGGVFSLIIGQ